MSGVMSGVQQTAASDDSGDVSGSSLIDSQMAGGDLLRISRERERRGEETGAGAPTPGLLSSPEAYAIR